MNMFVSTEYAPPNSWHALAVLGRDLVGFARKCRHAFELKYGQQV